jgi:hypothetical protein
MATTTQIILDGERLFIGKYTDVAEDGTAVTITIDVSALKPSSHGNICNGLKINKIWAQTQGMSVDIIWDASTDVLCETIPENQFYLMDYSSFGGIPNAAGAGVTGDILITTVTPAAGDRYTIILECIKTYDPS